MIKSNEIKLNEAINILNKIGVNNNQIMVLGSIALDICGLFPPYRHEAHDVDLMIRCNKNQEGDIKRMCQLVNVVTGTDSQIGSESSVTVMMCKNVIINLWFMDENLPFNTIMTLPNGVFVEKPIDCINKKKQYNRTKDMMDINSIIKHYLL